MNKDSINAMSVLPHSAEAEQAVICSILNDPNCLSNILDKISPDDFYIGTNKAIYKTAIDMYESGMPIDQVTLPNRMKLDEAGKKHMRQLMAAAPNVNNVGEYAKIVAEQSAKRQIVELSKNLTAMVGNGTSTVQEMLELAENEICNISYRDEGGGLRHVSEAVLSAYETLDERTASDQMISGIQTGLPDLDEAINGLSNSHFIVMGARPGMGKTAMGLEIALHAGKFSGKDVAIFSLEMTMEEYALRLISQESRLDSTCLTTGHLSDKGWEKVMEAAMCLDESRIYINENPSITVAEMKAQCRRLSNLGLVVIDYLQLMQSTGGKSNRNETRPQAVSDISRSLKIMAKELNVPVLCLSQLNRECEGRQEKRPMLSDLRESGAIEQDADVVLFLHRDEYYDRDAKDSSIAECIIGKNRHGATGTVKLGWLPEYTAFVPLSELANYGGVLPYPYYVNEECVQLPEAEQTVLKDFQDSTDNCCA